MSSFPLRWRTLGALALSAWMAASAAAAADKPLWELGIGASVLSLPHYRGSDQSQAWLLPLPYAVYRGQFFKADREGARAVFLDAKDLEVEFSVSGSAPTRSGDNRARLGMPKLAPTLEVGPKVNWLLARSEHWKLELRTPLRAAFTVGDGWRHVGWSATSDLAWDGRHGPWDLGARLGVLWGDRRYHAHFYDVTAAQETAQRTRYASSAGYAGWQTTLGASRRVGDVWIGAFLRHDSVAGAAFEGSSLVRARRNLAAGVALTWVFAKSSVLVAADD